ncbi:MAG: Na+/glucose cotransporter, partial [Bacteroidota bacterium]
KLTLEITKSSFTEGGLMHSIANINWLVFGAYFFAICIAIAIGVSMLYPAPSEQQLKGLTFGTVSAEQKAANKNSYGIADIIASIVVVLIVIYVMISFSTLSL